MAGLFSPSPEVSSKGRIVLPAGAVALAILICAIGGGVAWKLLDPNPAQTSTLTANAATSTPQAESANTTSSTADQPLPISHVPLPDEVRGIYWTGYTAGSSRADELLKHMLKTHLNSVVIDLKLDNGMLAFVPKDPGLQEAIPKYPAIKDLDGLLTKLAENHIYRIARIFIMRDGAFGKLHPNVALKYADGSIWHDKTGTPWLDPAAPEVADYGIALAKEAYARGFDEVQFDYVRFPTDGKLSAIHFPVYDGKTSKIEIMKAFFKRVGSALQAEKIPISFDLFGMTFWTVLDFDIGQRLPDAFPYSSAISPMVYPSHYPRGFEGFANPAVHPYEIVKRSLDKGIDTLKLEDPNVDPALARKKFRPWIQDFDIGANYDAAKIEAQIKAARDASAGGWLIWNARNVYTPATYLK